tara:strand:- start:11923 stop:16044 length:4122 start_codon:yes stop_codon:yes gene_type:complete
MKINVVAVLVWLFLGFNNFTFGQVVKGNQRFETLGNQEGFLQNTVKAITSDKNGYLWFSTPNGLIRYDGYSFENYYHNSENPASIPDNYIDNLLSDSFGRLWIGSRKGLCLYYPDEESFIPLKNSINNETFIKEDTQKNVWIGKDSKLYVYKSNIDLLNDKVKEIDFTNQLKGEKIVDISFLSDSKFIIATSSKIYKVLITETTDDSYEIQSVKMDFIVHGIKKIIKGESSWWIGTTKGLYHTLLEHNNMTIVKSYFNTSQSKTDSNYHITSLFLDKENKLWVGTFNNGVLQYNPEEDNFLSYTYDSNDKDEISSNRILSYYEDEFSDLWIGTVQGGISKLNKNQKPFYNYVYNLYDDQSISGNLITDIKEGQDGKIWFSFFKSPFCYTENALLPTNINNLKFEKVKNELKLTNDLVVLSFFTDQRGYQWIGTSNKIFLFDKINNKLHLVQIEREGKAIETTQIRKINQIDADHILIGGSTVCLLKNPWKNILSNKPVQIKNEVLNLGFVNDFITGRKDNYWIATRKGLYRVELNNEKIEVKYHLSAIPNIDGLQLSYDDIFSIHKSQDKKNIWLGSFGGGLMKIQLDSNGNPKQVKSYLRKDGLPDEAIYGIIEDDYGVLWMSTDRGICQFNPINETFDVYNVNDGLLSENYRQSAYLKTKSGLILMGGVNGLTVFDPKKIKKNQILPKLTLSDLKINNQLITPKQLYNNKLIIKKSISDTKKLVLDYKNRNISLDVLVQHYSTPKKNRVSYKLEGVNKDWIQSEQGKITAIFTNLSPGTYRFMYKGANGDGVWTTKARELIIKVLAPWYLRWWSLSIFGVLILLISYQIFRYSVRQEKLKQKLNFEKLDKERIHEMDEAKLRFFTNISHDFKTPLSLIMGPFEKIADGGSRVDNQKYFSIIKNNISRLQRLVDQLISYRKAESGHLELSYSKTTLGEFMYPLMEAFEENTKDTHINFYYKINKPEKEIIIDINKTERILLNLYSNAVKYSGLESSININAGFKEDKEKVLYFEVADTGIGISPEKLSKIFDRFYRGVEDRGNWSGGGVGLALSKSLIDLMQGTISVESNLGEKTIFSVSLPYQQNTFLLAAPELNTSPQFVTDWLPEELEKIQVEETELVLPVILIIDDEKDVRLFLQEALKSKYKVILAVDGEDGLEKLNKVEPQLVISDVMMPKLNGYQVCEKIKSNPQTCHIPVILLTAIDEADKKIEGFELGADDYIPKPFSIKHLEVRIKQLIESKQQIINYFSNHSLLPKKGLSLSEIDQSFLKKIINTIEKNISDSSFGVEELSKNIGMSSSHFYRKLKQLTGQAPNLYLRNFRLQKAAELLRANKNLHATEVMYQIGISSPSYFSTSFKKLHGLSPSEFVKNS